MILFLERKSKKKPKYYLKKKIKTRLQKEDLIYANLNQIQLN